MQKLRLGLVAMVLMTLGLVLRHAQPVLAAQDTFVSTSMNTEGTITVVTGQ